MSDVRNKILAYVLILVLYIYNIGPAAISVVAQEVTPTPPEESQTQDSSTSDTPGGETGENLQSVDPTPTPGETGSENTTTETPPEVTPTPTLIPTPTPIPYWSDEYDAWKAEQEKLDDEMEAREAVWDAHDNDPVWVAEHGGNEYYYTSGQWEADQEAAAATAAAAAAEENDAVAETDVSSLLQSDDPFSGQDITTSGSPGTVTGGCGTAAEDTTDSQLGGGGASSALSTDNDTAAILNNNCTEIANNSYAGGISGDNTSSFNDGPVGVNTGSASANGTLVNQGNINGTATGEDLGAEAVSGDSLASGTDAENLATGEDSENIANATVSDTLLVDNNNGAFVNNQMTVEGVSGSNEVVGNDGDVALTSGDIELIANMLNILNVNVTGDDFIHLIVNIFGQLNGTLDLDDIASYLGLENEDALEVIATNGDTGDDSTNSASASQTETTDINNTNSAVVNNEMNVTGVSGGNNVSGNDGGADVITGRIQILANLMNFINANFSGDKWSFIMINIFGGLTGDILLPETDTYLAGEGGAVAENTNVGEGSVNGASATSTESTTVTNTNSVALTNTINAEGVSGNNEQIGNDDGDGGHTVSSGGVDIVTQLINFLDFSITGDNWVFLIVNVFGTWYGKIVGFAGGGDMLAPADGSFAALAVGGEGQPGVYAGNVGTGEDSTNSADASLTSTTDVTNTNSAVVNNEMNISGISGGNSVNQNDAGTSLTTGWVQINANLLNIINMNITGNNWLVVFLNIFGDFIGNLYFGEPPAAPQVAVAQETTQSATPEQNESGGSQQAATPSGDGDSNTTDNNDDSMPTQSQALVSSVKITSNGRKMLVVEDMMEDNFQKPKEDDMNKVLSYSSGEVEQNGETFVENRGIRAIITEKFIAILERLLSAFKHYLSSLLGISVFASE
ncbi:hypothetical protein A2141_02375 [Candidatus Woesebacteria bacterium RBG_16_40_11]|nr:MAG: hypothetical protein A2141_02375 [Candidatus Woesebacteria bacterium RBG_16_40_11]